MSATVYSVSVNTDKKKKEESTSCCCRHLYNVAAYHFLDLTALLRLFLNGQQDPACCGFWLIFFSESLFAVSRHFCREIVRYSELPLKMWLPTQYAFILTSFFFPRHYPGSCNFQNSLIPRVCSLECLPLFEHFVSTRNAREVKEANNAIRLIWILTVFPNVLIIYNHSIKTV